MIYYPPELKYVLTSASISNADDGLEVEDVDPRRSLKYVKTDDWKLSIILAWLVFIHLSAVLLFLLLLMLTARVFFFIMFVTFVTFALLLTPPESAPSPPSLEEILTTVQGTSAQIQNWATCLGVSSAILATLQYGPQL